MRHRRLRALVGVLLLAAGPARAAGPLLVNGAGVPLVWSVIPVPFNPDRGTLGALANAAAVQAVADDFAVWAAVPTASISYTNAGALPVDVTAANYLSYLGVCGDGLSPIIFDTDGSITDDAFGPGASNDILGFASPDCGSFVPPQITEGVAVLNGKWIDGIDSPSNPEIPLADFEGVFVHEFGHYVNLDHSQINQIEGFDDDPSNDDAVATMFPFLATGTSTLHLDDRVSLSTLYPAPSFASAFGTISGAIFRSDGVTPFPGAYVIARQVGDPRITAVGYASGARYFPGNPGGPPPPGLPGLYEIPGLPPGSYTVEVEGVNPVFTGGSSVGPLDPPAALPGLPEFYNGANEAGTNPPDDPSQSVPLTVTAGATLSGIDVVLNGFPPATDTCGAPIVIAAVPYAAGFDASAATSNPSDPLQSCTFGGPNRNGHSVWFAFTAPTDLTLRAQTTGSGYDTVLTASTGSCGALTEIACDDDTTTLQSSLTFALDAGQTVLLEVTSFNTTASDVLQFQLSQVLPCDAAPLSGCHQPTASGVAPIKLSRTATHTRDLVLWKWFPGDATDPADFGLPTVSTDYTLCIYDQTGNTPSLRLGVSAPAAELCSTRPCWRETSSGFRYGDRTLTPNGLLRLQLESGIAGRARITLKGRGPLLRLPSLPFVQQSRVIVQLKNGVGQCWEADYSPPAERNDAGGFVDQGD